MQTIYRKYKDVIPYLFFGVCTTLVNIVVFWVFARLLNIGVMPSTVVAWAAAVLFAYLTNRKWVFHSEATGTAEIVKEIITFFGCRLATGFLDFAMMYLLVECLHFNDLFIKTSANLLVIVLNYVASKLVIFKRRT